MSEKEQSIVRKYNAEIRNIAYRLDQLEKGNIYEFTQARMDGYLATNIQKLRKELGELLIKIDNESPSIEDEIAKIFKNE